MTITYMDICKGGGGATLGAIAAGLTPLVGIEKDHAIASVARQNFDHPIYTKDIRELLFLEDELPSPDWLHASPPCVRASTANNGKETSEDMELAEAICRAISTLKPRYFSLENVAGYMNFDAFKAIQTHLINQGYTYDLKVLDCSNYGVPQSRKRLFLVASLHDYRALGFWERLKKQEPIGWKEAIADLIPSLKPTTLTGWQREAIHSRFRCDQSPQCYVNGINKNWPDLLIQRSGARKKNGIPNNTIRLKNEPIFTLKSMSGNVRPSVHQATIVVDGQGLQPDICCYSRWQTFPDSYQWPADFKLAMKICGNAVPPRMMEAIINAVLNPWT